MKKLFFVIMLLAVFCCAADAAEQRIISISPADTEIVYALGLEDSLVAVSTYCDYPPAVKGKEKIGSFSDPNLEKIVSLKPDLILATGLEQARVVQKLKSLKLNVLVIDPKNFGELFGSIRAIGAATGRQKEAEEVVSGMELAIEEVRSKAVSVPEAVRPKVYFEIWGNPLMTAGRGSFIDEMITIAGGRNITSDTDRPYSRFSPELVVERDPDVIILGYMAAGKAADELSKRVGWDRIAAVRAGKVYDDIDPNILLRPGPRLAQGLRELQKRFYGE